MWLPGDTFVLENFGSWQTNPCFNFHSSSSFILSVQLARIQNDFKRVSSDQEVEINALIEGKS